MGKWFQNKSFSTEKQEQGIKARKGHRGIKARKMHRAFGVLLAAALVFQTVPFEGIAVSASESSGGGLCEHHRSHTPDCGYKEAEPGHGCTHEHTEDCYRTVEGEDGSTTKELDCHHEHDESCGYREAAEGSPCTFVCEICRGGTDEIPEDNTEDNGINDGDSENPGTENGDEVKEPDDGQEECTCEERCTEDSINTDCPMCGAEDASLSDCKGKDTEDSTEDAEESTDQPEDTSICKHHREHDDACGYLPESEDSEGSPCTYECRICPIEALIAALPDDVTSDNADDVWGQLEEILALFSERTEDEQEQIDLSRVYELQGALDVANDPTPLSTGDVDLYSTNTVTLTEAECSGGCQGHKITQSYTQIVGATILVESGTHNITFSGLNLRSAAVGIMPGGTMNLTLVGTNKIVGSGCGFYVPVGATLVITEQSTGSLDISLTNSTTAAGIGGAYYDPNENVGDFSCGMVVINGGTITAAGRDYSAGIGGASHAPNFGNGGNITITGGHVTATGSNGAPGIGGGKDADSDGSLILSSADVLAENTTLGAKGTYTINDDPTEDMIVVPELVYTGEALDTSDIKIDDSKTGTATYFGQTFQVKASADGWVLQDLGEVREAKEYTATFKKDDKEISKTFTVAQSGTQFVGDGTVKTYKDGAECSDFTADDTITVKATPTATGKAPTKAAARLKGDPTAGQMAVFVGSTQVSEAVNAVDGTYTMTVSAADVLAAAGGPGTGITLTAKFVGNDNMADGAGTVDVSISAVAKIERDKQIIGYVGESGLDAAFADSGNSGATITLLANVTRATTLAIKVNCTLDLNGHNIKSTNGTCLSVYGSFAVTIQGEGEIISEQSHALVCIGTVTLEGGTFTGNGENFAGVYANTSSTLSVTGENVTIQNTGGGYGLAVNDATSVQLSAGTYSGTAGAISIVGGSLTLGDLLGHSSDTRYAYFRDTSTTPLTGVLDDKSLTGTVRVQKCKHDKSVCAYTPNGDADTHAMTCRACGLAGAVEDCQLTYTSNETQHTAACETCGRTRTEAHSYGSWTPQYSATAVTIQRICESCKYTKTDGTFTVPAPGQTMQYGKPITLTCSSTLPDAAFQWLLKSSADMSNVQKSIGASFTPSETLAVGEYCWDARVNWTGGNTIAKRGYLSVLPAPLSNVNVTLSPASAVYNGTAQKPAVAIDGLTEGTDYTVAYTGDFTNAGTHTVTVTGKGNYEGTVTKTFTIEKAEQTDFAFAAVTKPYEKNGTFTLSTTGGGGNGAVLYRVPENNGVLMVNGDQATIIGVGTVTVTATKAESENYKAATATGTVTIRKATAPAITYPTAGSITYGQKLSDCTLTGGSTEYGTFAWENGSTIPAVNNTGYTVVFTASKETEKNYETITNTTQKVTVKVEKAVPAVSVTAAVSGSKDNRQAVLTVNVAKAGAFPTGTVTFIDCTDGTKIGTATLTGGSATCTWEGLQDKEYTVRAVYAGNDNYMEAESRELTFDAAKQNQQDFSLDAIGAKTYGDAAITLKTTGGSGNGAVRYESSDEDVIRIEGGRAVIVGAGTATITAIKEGDDNYNEASASRNVTVAKKALTVRADSKTVVRGNPMPALTYRADGLVNGDTFTAAPSITADVQNTDTLGKYDIVISGGTLRNSGSYSITYVNGTLNIVERFYTVTVTDGTGSGEYAEGDTVTVTADERNGYTFTGWSSGDGIAFADSKAKTTTFTMPAKAVTVKANYTRNSSGGNNGGGSGGSGNHDGGGNSGGNEDNGGQGSGTNPGNGSTTPQIPVIPPAENTNPGNGATPGTGTTPVNPGTENTVRPGSSAGAPAQGTKQPFIKGADGKIGWDVIRAEEEQAQEGSTINVDMNGSTVVPGDIFDSMKGKDITITFDMGNGILWSVDGKSITADKAGDIDFSVKTGVNTVPVDIINNVTGESYSIQISLAHEGEFGFTAVLSIGLGKENAGYTASLYYYNENTGELEFICSDEVAEDGTVSLAFTHASDYVIAIDEKQEGGDGVAESAQPDGKDGTAGNGTAMEEPPQEGQQWRPWWLVVAGVLVLAMGAGVFFIRKKKGDED